MPPSPEGRLNSAGEMAPSESEQWLSETVISSLYMTFCIEYHVNIAGQVIRVHTAHGNVLPEGCDCFVQFRNPRWYAGESEQVELERIERQVI